MLGGAVAAIIVFPGVADITAFGEKLSPGQGGVLGALVAALLAVYVEKWCRALGPGGAGRPGHPDPHGAGLGPGDALRPDVRVPARSPPRIGTFANWLLQHGGAVRGLRPRRPLPAPGHAGPAPGADPDPHDPDRAARASPSCCRSSPWRARARSARPSRSTSGCPATPRSARPSSPRSRRLAGRGRAADLRRLAAPRPPLHHGVRGRRVRRRHSSASSTSWAPRSAPRPSARPAGPCSPCSRATRAWAPSPPSTRAAWRSGYLVGFLATYFFGFSKQMLTELNAEIAEAGRRRPQRHRHSLRIRPHPRLRPHRAQTKAEST